MYLYKLVYRSEVFTLSRNNEFSVREKWKQGVLSWNMLKEVNVNTALSYRRIILSFFKT